MSPGSRSRRQFHSLRPKPFPFLLTCPGGGAVGTAGPVGKPEVPDRFRGPLAARASPVSLGRHCAFRLTHPGIRRTGCRSFVKVVGPWLRGTPPVDPQTQGAGRLGNRVDRPTGDLRVAGQPAGRRILTPPGVSTDDAGLQPWYLDDAALLGCSTVLAPVRPSPARGGFGPRGSRGGSRSAGGAGGVRSAPRGE